MRTVGLWPGSPQGISIGTGAVTAAGQQPPARAEPPRRSGSSLRSPTQTPIPGRTGRLIREFASVIEANAHPLPAEGFMREFAATRAARSINDAHEPRQDR